MLSCCEGRELEIDEMVSISPVDTQLEILTVV